MTEQLKNVHLITSGSQNGDSNRSGESSTWIARCGAQLRTRRLKEKHQKQCKKCKSLKFSTKPQMCPGCKKVLKNKSSFQKHKGLCPKYGKTVSSGIHSTTVKTFLCGMKARMSREEAKKHRQNCENCKAKRKQIRQQTRAKKQQDIRGSQDSIKDSKENIGKTRNMRISGSSLGPLAIKKPRKALRELEEGMCQPQEIKNGELVRASLMQTWIHTEYQNPMWNGTKTGGFYQQRTPGNPRGGWTMALYSGSWRRSTTKNPEQGSNARHRDTTKKVAASQNLYGELQVLRRTYEDKLKGPLQYTERPKSPTYSMHRKVVRASYIGMRQGYDLEVDHLCHNFLLASGLCCSNSHAAAYALITYQTAWLKTHYPVEFMCAVMTAETGNKDDMIKSLSECKTMGIEVLPPDINESEENFHIDDDNRIHFGLSPIKNLGAGAKEVIKERKENGEFKNLQDFCERVNLGVVNRLKLDSLVKAGAFDRFGFTRASTLAAIEDIWQYRSQMKSFDSKLTTYNKKLTAVTKRTQDMDAGVLSSTGKKLRALKTPDLPETPVFPEISHLPELSEGEIQQAEHELLGFYVTSHPLDELAGTDAELCFNTIEQIKQFPTGSKVSMAVVITQSKEITTKKKKKMGFLTIEDLTGNMEEVVLFPKIFEMNSAHIEENCPIRLDGVIDATTTDEEKITKLIVKRVGPVSLKKKNLPLKRELTIKSSQARGLADLSKEYSGDYHEILISLIFQDGTKVRLHKGFKINKDLEGFLKDFAGL